MMYRAPLPGTSLTAMFRPNNAVVCLSKFWFALFRHKQNYSVTNSTDRQLFSFNTMLKLLGDCSIQISVVVLQLFIKRYHMYWLQRMYCWLAKRNWDIRMANFKIMGIYPNKYAKKDEVAEEGWSSHYKGL